eukprot:4629559-Alexandrium_andersonii.AAC.1
MAEPSLAGIRKAVLRAHGSAPGADGLPYELFHLGCDFVADLVGQAFHASRLGDDWLGPVLGPNIELPVSYTHLTLPTIC